MTGTDVCEAVKLADLVVKSRISADGTEYSFLERCLASAVLDLYKRIQLAIIDLAVEECEDGLEEADEK